MSLLGAMQGAARTAFKAAAGIAFKASYEAAGLGRRLAGWHPTASGPNRAKAGMALVRNRSRDSARNDWAVATLLRDLVANHVGTGIVPRPKTKNKRLKKLLVEWWNTWVKDADADGALDFYGLLALAARTMFNEGECFVRLRFRRLDDGLIVPLQLQLLSAAMVPMAKHEDLPNGNRIRQGIELDRRGRRVAYHVYKEHPGEGEAKSGELVRIPASQILHLYEVLEPGELRGTPRLAPVLIKTRVVADYDDATVERGRLQNLFMGFIKKLAPDPSAPAVDPLTGQVVSYSSGVGAVPMEPGAMVELNPGEEMQFSNPPGPGEMYDDFMRQQHMHMAAGAGTVAESLTGDLREISDRTLRVALQNRRRAFRQTQWHNLIAQLCIPIRAAWAEQAVLVGLVPISQLGEAADAEWAPEAWEYIHPVQDVQGAKIAVDAGFRSRSSVMAERGDDPEQVDEERMEDAKREESIRPATSAAPAKHDAGDDEEDQQ